MEYGVDILCETCNGKLSLAKCPSGGVGCETAHVECRTCKKEPCRVCRCSREYDAQFGICPQCYEAGILWAARHASD